MTDPELSTMSRVGLVYDSIMGEHKSDEPHVERPERIFSIYQALEKADLIDQMTPVTSYEATREELTLAHVPEYLERIMGLLSRPESQIYISDPDMYANSKTLKAARIAAGSTLHLTKEVIAGRLDSGFAVVRPPGHHAMPGKCMGFCYFNNLGISAIHAARTGRRVLIVDWDVHFGNGTERLVRKNKDLRNLLFISLHRWDNGTFYPGSGKSSNTERVMNIGFNGSRGDGWYLATMKDRVLSRAQEFAPDLILVSCGFDAARGDPLGQCDVTPMGYYKMVKLLQSVCPQIILVLEGGYNLNSISSSAVACVKALLNSPLDEIEDESSESSFP